MSDRQPRLQIPRPDFHTCDPGTQFTRFTSTTVQILTHTELQFEKERKLKTHLGNLTGTHFTCFTSTKVQILTR